MHRKIEELVSTIKFSELKAAALSLSEKYRSKQFTLKGKRERLAYLVTRLPATFSALQKVFYEIRHLEIASLLDLGAGPGAGWLAAKQFFPLQRAVCIEADDQFISLGRQLVEGPVMWLQGDLSKEPYPASDLVLFSYSIGELGNWSEPLARAWQAAQKALVIVEPGTPESFIKMRLVREKLIELGAFIAAPCPHQQACPSRWCHFSARLARSSQHRLAKEGSLGYEDEKFSYVVALKKPQPSKDRIVRHPEKRKGHVVFSLCTPQGKLESRTVAKSDQELYKKARKLSWGDSLP